MTSPTTRIMFKEDVQYSPKDINKSKKNNDSNAIDILMGRNDVPEFDSNDDTESLLGEFKTLMDRITYLEDKLNRESSSPQVIQKKKKKKKKRKPINRSPIKSKEIKNVRQNDNKTDRDLETQNYSNVHDANRKRLKFDNVNDSEQVNSTIDDKNVNTSRPFSAPSSRKPLTNPRASNWASKLSTKTNNWVEKEESIDRWPKPKVDSIYTYDMRSGRKLLKSKWEEIEKMMAVKNNNQIEGGKENPSISLNPVRSDWPGPGTSRSVRNWLEKVKQSRQTPVEIPKRIIHLEPKIFNSYKKMQNLDLIISVEHCFNCEYHTTSLRHDPEEYVVSADALLRHMALVTHQQKPSARLGVIRFRANITPKSKQTDENSRIGAFEVQIAFRNHTGQLVVEVIHSKLYSRLWPSKGSVEKRLLGFFTKVGIQSYHQDTSSSAGEVAAAPQYSSLGINGLDNYPVGKGPWTATLLSSDSWTFPQSKKNTPICLDGHSKTMVVTSDTTGNDGSASPKPSEVSHGIDLLPFIQWVFDSRESFSKPKFESGTMLRIHRIQSPYDSMEKERQPLLGVLVRNTIQLGKLMIIARLTYTAMEITCNPDDCVSASDYSARTILMSNERNIPLELETFLEFGRDYKLLNWKILEKEDREEPGGIIVLSRASLFRQFRQVVFEIERKVAANTAVDDDKKIFDRETNTVRYAPTRPWIDLQLVYSEEALNWLQDRFGRTVNTKNLEKLVSPNITLSPRDLKINTDVTNSVETSPRRVSAVLKEAASEISSYNLGIMSADVSTPSKRMHRITGSLRDALKEVTTRLTSDMRSNRLSSPTASTPTGHKSKGIKALFKKLDADGTGYLEIGEFAHALELFGLKYDRSVLEAIHATFDIDGDGKISFNEFVQFLNHDCSDGTRELGEIWTILRSGLKESDEGGSENGSEEEVEDLRITLNELESRFHHAQLQGGLTEGILSEHSFTSILQHSGLNNNLEPADMSAVVLAFKLISSAPSKKDNPPSSPSKPREKVAMKEQTFIRYDDFISWLHPVDVEKVCKRIGRFVRAVLRQENGMGKAEINSVDGIIALLDIHESNGVSKTLFETVVNDLGLPVAAAEIRALFRSCNSDEMTVEMLKDILHGHAPGQSAMLASNPVLAAKKLAIHKIIDESYGISQPKERTPPGYSPIEYDDDIYEEDFYAPAASNLARGDEDGASFRSLSRLGSRLEDGENNSENEAQDDNNLENDFFQKKKGEASSHRQIRFETDVGNDNDSKTDHHFTCNNDTKDVYLQFSKVVSQGVKNIDDTNMSGIYFMVRVDGINWSQATSLSHSVSNTLVWDLDSAAAQWRVQVDKARLALDMLTVHAMSGKHGPLPESMLSEGRLSMAVAATSKVNGKPTELTVQLFSKKSKKSGTVFLSVSLVNGSHKDGDKDIIRKGRPQELGVDEADKYHLRLAPEPPVHPPPRYGGISPTPSPRQIISKLNLSANLLLSTPPRSREASPRSSFSLLFGNEEEKGGAELCRLRDPKYIEPPKRTSFLFVREKSMKLIREESDGDETLEGGREEDDDEEEVSNRNQSYGDRDVEFTEVTVRGDCLLHPEYDDLCINVTVENQSLSTESYSSSMLYDEGTGRDYAFDWSEVRIPSESFRSNGQVQLEIQLEGGVNKWKGSVPLTKLYGEVNRDFAVKVTGSFESNMSRFGNSKSKLEVTLRGRSNAASSASTTKVVGFGQRPPPLSADALAAVTFSPLSADIDSPISSSRVPHDGGGKKPSSISFGHHTTDNAKVKEEKKEAQEVDDVKVHHALNTMDLRYGFNEDDEEDLETEERERQSQLDADDDAEEDFDPLKSLFDKSQESYDMMESEKTNLGYDFKDDLDDDGSGEDNARWDDKEEGESEDSPKYDTVPNVNYGQYYFDDDDEEDEMFDRMKAKDDQKSDYGQGGGLYGESEAEAEEESPEIEDDYYQDEEDDSDPAKREPRHSIDDRERVDEDHEKDERPSSFDDNNDYNDNDNGYEDEEYEQDEGFEAAEEEEGNDQLDPPTTGYENNVDEVEEEAGEGEIERQGNHRGVNEEEEQEEDEVYDEDFDDNGSVQQQQHDQDSKAKTDSGERRLSNQIVSDSSNEDNKEEVDDDKVDEAATKYASKQQQQQQQQAEEDDEEDNPYDDEFDEADEEDNAVAAPSTKEGSRDRDLLIELYDSTGGTSHWGDTVGWKSDQDLCNWFGVITSVTVGSSRVTELRLRRNGLHHTLPSSVGKLTGLLTLDLSHNQLQGKVPDSLSNLATLKVLNLSYNSLSGRLPDSLSSLTSLETLKLQHNKLQGNIPDTFTKITTLKEIFLQANELTGRIPLKLAELPSLVQFHCDMIPYSSFHRVRVWIQCQYSELNQQPYTGDMSTADGDFLNVLANSVSYLDEEEEEEDRNEDSDGSDISVRAFWEKWNNGPAAERTSLKLDRDGYLQSLVLPRKGLRDSLPAEIGMLEKLVYLDLSSNSLSGVIPSEILGLANLKYLFLEKNFLEGPIPDEICFLEDLKMIDLGCNALSGFLPTELSQLTNLEYLGLEQNDLDGSLLPEIGSLTRIKYLNLSSNQFSGTIPDTLKKLTSLEYLYLSSNQLTGTIPSSLRACRHLKIADCSLNALSVTDSDLSFTSMLKDLKEFKV